MRIGTNSKLKIIPAHYQRLIDWAFRRQNPALSRPREIFVWWEKRRLFFNLVVGLAGVLTCTVFLITALIANEFTGQEMGVPDPPIFALFGVVLYGIAANVCYTSGAISEIIALRFWKEKAGSFGEIAFFLGMVSSIAITLLPALLFVLLVTIAVLTGSRPEA